MISNDRPNIGRTTLLLPHCWVCSKRFRNSVPPGPAMREDHHIFPRNAGGEDGPLVSLCDTHHSCLHAIAKRIQRKADFKDLLATEVPAAIKKLLWLAQQVVKAEALVDGDENKKFIVTIKLKPAELKVLNKLQQKYKKGREDIIRASLLSFYKETFK